MAVAHNELSLGEIEFLIESLSYTKLKFENYAYEDYTMKRKQLDKVDVVMGKLRRMRDEQRAK